MSRQQIIGCLAGVVSSCALMGSVLAASEPQQADRNKGVTIDDLTRGLRSAARNIEKEIPKIGPAIGKTVKSITGNSSEKTRSQHPPSDRP
jgi:hypothetical protein